jgi:hypothetical protein
MVLMRICAFSYRVHIHMHARGDGRHVVQGAWFNSRATSVQGEQSHIWLCGLSRTLGTCRIHAGHEAF